MAKTKRMKAMKRVTNQARVLTNEELTTLFDAAGCYADLYRIAYLTASRLSEVRELSADAIHPSEVRIPQSKQHREKRVRIRPTLRAVLDRLPTEGPLFSISTTHKPVSRSTVHKHLTALADELGLSGTTTHSFRRSRATHLYQAKVPAKTIMQLTGHADLATFLRYVDIGVEEVAEAAADLDCSPIPHRPLRNCGNPR